MTQLLPHGIASSHKANIDCHATSNEYHSQTTNIQDNANTTHNEKNKKPRT